MNPSYYKALPPIQRKPDGSLPSMTPKQRAQARKLIREECCNYDNGNCVLLGNGDSCACVQSISYTVLCKWFRIAVLPLDKPLEAVIFKPGALKHCTICKTAFAAKSNRNKYCTDCAKRAHRIQKTTSERNRRSKVDS